MDERKESGKLPGRKSSGATSEKRKKRDREKLAEMYREKGYEYEDQGKFDKARRYFERAIRCSPDFDDVYSELAYIYGVMGEYENVVEVLKRKEEMGLSLNFADFVYLGNAYERLGDLRLAQRYLNEALSLNPRSGVIYFSLGDLYMRMGHFKKAEAYYRFGLFHESSDPGALNNLGHILLERGEYGEAEECFKKALSVEKNLFEAKFNLARLYSLTGRLRYAIRYFEEALSLKKQEVECLYYLTRACFIAGEFEKGEVYLEELSRTEPSLARAVREEFGL